MGNKSGVLVAKIFLWKLEMHLKWLLGLLKETVFQGRPLDSLSGS